MLKFVHQAIRDIRQTGSVCPSSPLLARAMTKSLRNHRGTKRVLEVGPGTGPFTGSVLDALRGHDAFDIVEINDAFCRHLEHALLAPFRAHHPAISIALHQAPIEQADLEGSYDFIVCGLPFNNFPLAMTKSIFARMLSLLRDGGELTYFEYAGMRTLKRPFVGSNGRACMRGMEDLKRQTAKTHRVTQQLVVANIPPASAIRVIKCKEIPGPCSD